MTVIVEQIVSADGFAAAPDGGIGFMGVANANANDRAQLRMLEDVDAIVLGRTTYGMFADYWPHADPDDEPVAEPIARLPKLVVSATLERAPWGDGEIEVLRPDPDAVAAVRALEARFPTVIVWGSLTLTDALFAAGAVDRLRLRAVPALLGEGRRIAPEALGSGEPGYRELRHTSTEALASGHVVTEYALT